MRARVPFRLIALVAVALVIPSAARATVDFTGEWTTVHVIPGFEDANHTEVWTVVQTGTQIAVTIQAVGGPPSGPYQGTIDPDTGVFDVPLPDVTGPPPFFFPVCTGNHFTGTVSADGMTVSGQWINATITPGNHFCFPPDHYFSGAHPGCGTGVVDAGEACDDGNVADGDCCAADCRTTAPDGTACDDGDVCTGPDQCSAGRCTTQPLVCGPCEVCGASGCAPPVDAGCQPALAGGKAKVTLVAGSEPKKDKLNWTWKSSGAVSVADLGFPDTSTDYTLCVIDDAGGTPTVQLAAMAPPGGTCGTKPCWKFSLKGWDYRDAAATPDGVTSLDLDVGASAGCGKLVAKGKGADLGVPDGPLTPPVIVRLVRDDAATCWESTHSAPQLNVGGKFKASSD